MKRSFKHIESIYYKRHDYFGDLMSRSMSPVFMKNRNWLVGALIDFAELTFNEIRKSIDLLAQYQNPLKER